MRIGETESPIREITKEEVRNKIENKIHNREQFELTNPRADWVWKQEAEKIVFTPDGGYTRQGKDKGRG